MKKVLDWILSVMERYGLKLTLWCVVTVSLLAIISKAVWERPSTVPFHYLLIIAMVAAVLAVIIPNLESLILSRISEIDIGGVKVVIAKAREIRERIEFKEIPNTALTNADPSDRPFPEVKLHGYQIYEYERLSHKLYQTFDEINDPNTLTPALSENYRDLIKHVGRMAFSMEHYSKYLDIVRRLELFRDRELSSDEQYTIGSAYLWAADEQFDLAEKERYWNKSSEYLTSALKKNSRQVRIAFGLGVAFLYLGHYSTSIKLMRRSIKLWPQISPWASWNMGCGYIKQNEPDKALAVLKSIDKGAWWQGIKNDDWFSTAVPAEFKEEFDKLCKEKMRPH